MAIMPAGENRIAPSRCGKGATSMVDDDGTVNDEDTHTLLPCIRFTVTHNTLIIATNHQTLK